MREVLAAGSEVIDAHPTLERWLARAARPDQAVAGRARFNLAQLLRQGGDQAGYLAELRASTEQAPDFGPSFFFLAREELLAAHLDAAADLARRGLVADRASEVSPLGRYVLADVLGRQGRTAEAKKEAEGGRRLALRRTPPPRV